MAEVSRHRQSHQMAMRSMPYVCVPQAGTGAQPKRRSGLLGLMKRNKSEIGAHSLVPTMFKRFHAHAQQEAHPQPIAEDGIEGDGHNDLFASPR